MKIDYLGEYDEFAIPHEFQAPLHSDPGNNAIACENGKILGTYNFVNESVLLAHAKRRAEFAVMMANGEIIVDFGKVFKRIGSQYQDGKIVVSYEPIGEVTTVEKVAENGHSDDSKATGEVVKKLSQSEKMKAYWAKKRAKKNA